MKVEYDKIELDMNEFVPLLLQDKQEGFRRIGDMLLSMQCWQKSFCIYRSK